LSFQRMQHVQKEGGTKDTFNLGELWNPQTNLSTTIDNFVAQILQVREGFRSLVKPKAVSIFRFQVLWEVFAGNIVHFEVETRDEKNEVGSSSSSPIQFKDKWGGEVVHLTALQELGRLAMLSNKSDSDTMKHLKSNNIQHLWQQLDKLCMTKEQLVDAYGSFDFISTHVLQKLREIFEGLFVYGQLLDHNDVESQKDMRNQEIYDHKKSVPTSVENGLGDSISSYLTEKSQINSVDYPSQQFKTYKHPTTNILDGDLLEVDPFAILTHWLLSVSTFFITLYTNYSMQKISMCCRLLINSLKKLNAFSHLQC
jgi:hypothetical protein